MIECLSSKEPAVVLAAVTTVGELRYSEAVRKLTSLLAESTSNGLRTAVLQALLRLNPTNELEAKEMYTAVFAVSPLH
ncbi:HEAT repeat domain-containing protein, partial [Mycobacterium tuberculosis]|uniref:HEAT repeat domain-containing protein n=1 Tax=Mycobacterium tuberculosis TaxID=1773 RepID=UPI0033071469